MTVEKEKTVPGLTASELLTWSEETASRWFDFFRQSPELLDLPCGIYGTDRVLGLVRHIVAVELRYAERLQGKPVSTYESMPNTLDGLEELHRQTVSDFSILLEDSSQDWSREIEMKTLTAGTVLASQRKAFCHALLHGIRHWAQLASLLRSQGHPTHWPGDLLLSEALK